MTEEHDQLICQLAEVLRNPMSVNLNVKELNIYLMGGLEYDSVAAFIHHNNTNHQCTTAEQCGMLVELLKLRKKTSGTVIDPAILLSEVFKIIRKVENQAKPFKNDAEPNCHDECCCDYLNGLEKSELIGFSDNMSIEELTTVFLDFINFL